MKPIITVIAAIAVSVAFATTAEAKKSAGGKKGTPEEQFKKLDKDNDGFVSKAEATGKGKKSQKAEAAFAKKDKDGDGKLSLKEFTGKGKKGKKKK